MGKQSFFVTGTDTDVGKSAVTAGFLSLAAGAGLRTLAIKPVASGCDETPDGLRNADALHLQSAMTEALSYEQVNPVALRPAIAPHVAASEAGVSLSAGRLAGFCRGVMMRPGDLVLVEGAGGWRVPLNERETYADLPRAMEMPVILVVGLKLGCINHALLSAEAIRRDGLTLAGWVGNQCTHQSMVLEEQTMAYLRSQMPAPCLGHVPWIESAGHFPAPDAVAPYLALPAR